MANNVKNATPIIPENAGKVKDFDTLKRDYETALASGKDSGPALLTLSAAVAHSVIRKLIDPQRKAAADRDSVSDSGCNPAMLSLRRGLTADVALLDNLTTAANAATVCKYNPDGDMTTATVDAAALDAVDALSGETLSDGIDLAQTAALAILEQAAEHATAPGWLDAPYTVRRLSRRVYVRLTDSAAWADVETTPIQEVYRAVRRAVQESRAVQTDPRNGYVYIEAMDERTTDRLFYRAAKWADVGGTDSAGNYTGDYETLREMERLTARLVLTDRQAQVLRLRVQGHGDKAIATYLGVTYQAVAKVRKAIQDKARDAGLESPAVLD